MNSGSSAFMRSGSQVSGWPSTTASYQRSRGICMSTAPCVWRTTSTVSTESVPGDPERVVDVGLQRHPLAAAHALIGGDDQLGLAVLHAVGDRLRGEAAEHHRVHRADPRAGKHRHRGLGDHRQVDGDPVALAHAEVAQRVGQLAGTRVQLAIGEILAWRRGIVRLEDDRDLVAVLGQVAVQAIDAGVEFAILEPADAEVGGVEADVLDPGRRAHPVEAPGDARPERVGLVDRGLVLADVVAVAHGRMRGECSGDVVTLLLVAHGIPPEDD